MIAAPPALGTVAVMTTRPARDDSAVADVRAMRDADIAISDAHYARVAASLHADADSEAGARLLAALGLGDDHD